MAKNSRPAAKSKISQRKLTKDAKQIFGKKPERYIQSPGQIGAGPIPVTPPLSSAEARRQLRGF